MAYQAKVPVIPVLLKTWNQITYKATYVGCYSNLDSFMSFAQSKYYGMDNGIKAGNMFTKAMEDGKR